MESDGERKAFVDYITLIFTEYKKRNRRAVIDRSLEQRITIYLKGNKDEDKLFRQLFRDKWFHTKCSC